MGVGVSKGRDATSQSGKIRKFGKDQNVANKCINGVVWGKKYMCIDLISSGSKQNLFYQFLILSRNSPVQSQMGFLLKIRK